MSDPLISREDRELLLAEIPKMEGWLTPERAVEQYELIRLTQPTTVVEIGVFGGRGMLAKCLALRANGKGKWFGIDPWKLDNALEGENDPANDKWWKENVDLEKMHRLTMEAIWKHKLDDVAIVIRSASQHLPRLFPGGIDMVEIDGAHSELASCRDVNLYLPQLNHNGYVLMDDTDWPTTQKAQALVMEQCVEYITGGGGHYKIFCRQMKEKAVKRKEAI